MNMDYSLCQAVARTANGIHRILLLYDIACQYGVHLRDRVERNSHLSLPPSLDIIKGIGVWHVHGHVRECFPRYYPAFIPGSGHVDGEILETLWAHLNLISGSTRGMSAAHRQEVLDDHMNDSNWKKLVGIGIAFTVLHSWFFGLMLNSVDTLCRRYTKAMIDLDIARREFDGLNATVDQTLLDDWTKQEEHAMNNRASDVTVMDIYDVQMERGLLCQR